MQTVKEKNMADPTGKMVFVITDGKGNRLGTGRTPEEARRNAGLLPGQRPEIFPSAGHPMRDFDALARLILEDYDLL